jgi:hypothetical protein
MTETLAYVAIFGDALGIFLLLLRIRRAHWNPKTLLLLFLLGALLVIATLSTRSSPLLAAGLVLSVAWLVWVPAFAVGEFRRKRRSHSPPSEPRLDAPTHDTFGFSLALALFALSLLGAVANMLDSAAFLTTVLVLASIVSAGSLALSYQRIDRSGRAN